MISNGIFSSCKEILLSHLTWVYRVHLQYICLFLMVVKTSNLDWNSMWGLLLKVQNWPCLTFLTLYITDVFKLLCYYLSFLPCLHFDEFKILIFASIQYCSRSLFTCLSITQFLLVDISTLNHCSVFSRSRINSNVLSM